MTSTLPATKVSSKATADLLGFDSGLLACSMNEGSMPVWTQRLSDQAYGSWLEG